MRYTNVCMYFVFAIYLFAYTTLKISLQYTTDVRCTNIDSSILYGKRQQGSFCHHRILRYICKFIYPIFTSVTNNVSNFAGGNNFSLAKSVLSNFENLNDLSLYQRKTLSISPSHFIHKKLNKQKKIKAFSSMRLIPKLQYLK